MNKEVKNITLAEVFEQVEKYAKEHNLSQHQKDQYTIGQLSSKIVELDSIIKNRAK